MTELRDLYALMVREYRGVGTMDPATLDMNGFYWVMDLNAYKDVRAACRAELGTTYPLDDDDEPKPEDRLFGLVVDVRDDGGAPHLERR